MDPHQLWLIPLGMVVGALGTLIGAGGGFVLMPVLILFYPDENRDILASISLAVVFFNALSGSSAYARMKRIDYRSGALFAAATVPGAILGALTTSYMHRGLFDGILGTVLVGGSIFLLLRPGGPRKTHESRHVFAIHRRLVDAQGLQHEYSYNPVVGVGVSLVVGYLSTLLGVGGGFLHVPLLVYLLGFPVHVATATSHFVLAVMALAGTTTHVVSGSFTSGFQRTFLLGIGVIVGAQFGAWLSNRVHANWIIRGLAAALALAGLRILLSSL